MTIRLVGLGPGRAAGIDERALEALRAARAVLIRTERHPSVEALRARGISFITADDLYETRADFDELCRAVAERALGLAREHGDAAFAVPGHPLFGERSCAEVLRAAAERGIRIEVVGGKDFITATLEAVAEPFDNHLQVLNAHDVDSMRVDPRYPCLVYQVDCAETASGAKLALTRLYPDEHEVRVVTDGADPEAQTVARLPLYKLDRLSLGPRTTVYVPPLSLERAPGFYGLVDIVARLRGPDGCPWDIKQTHDSLKTHLIEETYEVLEALDPGDPVRLRDELGDFLLQALMHAQIDSEEGLYDIDDVIASQTEKLLRRHPHVFGDLDVESVDEVLRNWDKIKANEKGGEPGGALAGVPKTLPSLLRAYEVSKRAARLGFDWPSLSAVLDKVEEEIGELREALAADNPDRVRREVGDLLFAASNVARHAGVQPEESLRQMVARFADRFTEMERRIAEQGRDPKDLTPEEWEELWVRAKQACG